MASAMHAAGDRDSVRPPRGGGVGPDAVRGAAPAGGAAGRSRRSASH